MIRTSTLQRFGDDPHAVAVARRLHQYKTVRTCDALRPSSEMLRLSGADFVAAYTAQLAGLNPHAIASELGADAIIVCWERDPADCHRSLIAAWLSAAGIAVSEIP